MNIRTVVLCEVADRQTNKRQVKHNLSRGGNRTEISYKLKTTKQTIKYLQYQIIHSTVFVFNIF